MQEYKEARKSSIPFFTKLRELRSSKWNQCILDASARQLIEARSVVYRCFLPLPVDVTGCRPNIGKQWVALDSRESIHSVMSVFALGVHRVRSPTTLRSARAVSVCCVLSVSLSSVILCPRPA